MNRENLSEFIYIISNHCYTSTPQVQAHWFVNVSIEIIESSNVTFVTDGHLLPFIIIVAKLPGQASN
jgi:hypothetical protein